MSAWQRSNILILVTVLLGFTIVAVTGGMFLREVSEDRAVIRRATADHLRVQDSQVEITSFVSQGPCYVAQVTVRTAGDPTYSVAVHKQRPTPVVTRISGESLGSDSDPYFDTDDPEWEPICLTS